jgi:hypothetical protein
VPEDPIAQSEIAALTRRFEVGDVDVVRVVAAAGEFVQAGDRGGHCVVGAQDGVVEAQGEFEDGLGDGDADDSDRSWPVRPVVPKAALTATWSACSSGCCGSCPQRSSSPPAAPVHDQDGGTALGAAAAAWGLGLGAWPR